MLGVAMDSDVECAHKSRIRARKASVQTSVATRARQCHYSDGNTHPPHTTPSGQEAFRNAHFKASWLKLMLRPQFMVVLKLNILILNINTTFYRR